MVIDTPSSVKKSRGFVPNQVRSKYENSAAISEAPALYNNSKSSSSKPSNGHQASNSSTAALEKPPEPPQQLSALPYVSFDHLQANLIYIL